MTADNRLSRRDFNNAAVRISAWAAVLAIFGGAFYAGVEDDLQKRRAARNLSVTPTPIKDIAGVCGTGEIKNLPDGAKSPFTTENTEGGLLQNNIRALTMTKRGVYIGYKGDNQPGVS